MTTSLVLTKEEKKKRNFTCHIFANRYRRVKYIYLNHMNDFLQGEKEREGGGGAAEEMGKMEQGLRKKYVLYSFWLRNDISR